MRKEGDGKLESLPPEKQEWLLELAAHAARLLDCMQPLKEQGINVSFSTFRRYVIKHKKDQILENEADLKGTAAELAHRARDGAWREGTLAAVRQKLFENALSPQSSEETQAYYAALLQEEARAKELELAARRTAAMEARLELDRRRLELLAQSESRGRKPIQAHVETQVIEAEPTERMAPWSKVAPLLEMLSQVDAALNRDGDDLVQKVNEARSCLSGAQKLLELQNEIPQKTG